MDHVGLNGIQTPVSQQMPNGGLKGFGHVEPMITETENEVAQTNTIPEDMVTNTEDYHLTSHN